MHYFLSSIYWNPSREAFTVPYLDRPIGWYGLCFVAGFFLGYLLFIHLLTPLLREKNDPHPRERAIVIADRMLWFVVLGTIIGARLGHVFFYDWPIYRERPWDIPKVWEGGLASHGGVVGVMLGLFLFWYFILRREKVLSYLRLLDLVSIPSAMVGAWIRLGNFFNQEILGTPSNLPWAVVFGHPADGSFPQPRHPVQLYEGLAYLAIFAFLYWKWVRAKGKLPAGTIVGWLFVTLFAARLVLEVWKDHQSLMIDESFMQMGQYLSIPFILLGVVFLWARRREPSDAGLSPPVK